MRNDKKCPRFVDPVRGWVNNELKYISDWFSANKLVVNTTKTNFMVFSYRKIDFDDFNVKLNDFFITQVASVKFLGAIIDNKLSWTDHVPRRFCMLHVTDY